MIREEFIKKSKERLKRLLKSENLLDEKLEEAFDRVPREYFFPENIKENSYLNNAFEIGYGQTISQPTMIFIMLKRLDINKSHKVLEIGTGSGYLTALLCELAHFVYSVEIIPELAITAQNRLKNLGYLNFEIVIGDGSKGLIDYAPYDRIVVSAACPKIPQILVDQLSENGILALPVGSIELQRLVIVKKHHNSIETTNDVCCRFVPLIGEEGFKDENVKKTKN
ncbi:MAG: protein-L-isoaspartate(D-aspartate) O-methyltransferase [Brevinematales bacterium]|nr:protein-L-isoaspartate(D-aspartate) O-methyltransferase [Brevinematales bacterium]